MNVFSTGLLAGANLSLARLRSVPTRGSIEVAEGQTVLAETTIGYFNPHGNVNTYYLARELDISPFDVPEAMLKQEGESVSQGEVIARAKGLFSRKEFAAPEDGVLERVSPYTGWITIRGLPLPIIAGYPGLVERTVPGQGVYIRSQGALVQGIFGIGGSVSGRLQILPVSPDDCLEAQHMSPGYENCIVAGGARVSLGFLTRAARLGVRGIISGGVHKTDLDEFLGYSLGVAITGLEPTLTLILTEGFGHLPMRAEVLHIINASAHKVAYASGATQVRAGVIRPELFIPSDDTSGEETERQLVADLDPGSRVRIIRAPYFGEIGIVVSAPQVATLPTESSVLSVVVRLPSGEERVIPVSNIEPMGGQKNA